MNANEQESFQQDLRQISDRYATSSKQFVQASDPAGINAALDALPYIHPNDADAVQRAYRLATDRNQPVDLRLKAVARLTNALFQNETAVGDMIGLLGAADEPAEIRRAAMHALAAISFSSPALNAQMPAYRQALSSLLDSENTQLRQEAVEKLAGYRDENVQNLLLQGLDDPAKALVAEPKAVQLLGLDPRANHYSAIRKVLQSSKDDTAKREAVIALSADPGSQDLIRQTFLDKNSAPPLRLASLAALNSFDPKQFQPMLRDLVMDDKETHEMRAASLNSLSLHSDLSDLYRDQAFTDKVQSLGQVPNDSLKALSDTFLANRNNAS